MHRRQAVRQAAAAAIAGVAATVTEEQAARVNLGAADLVVVSARSEAREAADGTMGEGPADRRTLALTFDLYAERPTGAAAADALNGLDEAIGVALGVDNAPGGGLYPITMDLRWTATEFEIGIEQEKYIATGTVIYTVIYDLWYGDPT